MSVPVSYNVANPIALTASGVTVGFNFNNLNYTLLGTESIVAYVPFGGDTSVTTTLIAPPGTGEQSPNIDSVSYSYDYSATLLFECRVPIQGGSEVVTTFEMSIPDFKPSFLYRSRAPIKSSGASFGRKTPENNFSRKQYPRF